MRLKTGADSHGFPNREAIVDKVLERFLSVENQRSSLSAGLLDILRENLKSCQATVISGRARSGQTMLALDFVRRHEGRPAWYEVNAPDMSLPVFMEYLVGSVARVRPGIGCQTLVRHSRAFRSGETGVGGEFDIAATNCHACATVQIDQVSLFLWNQRFSGRWAHGAHFA